MIEDHSTLLQHLAQSSDLQNSIISYHEVLIYRLMKRLPALGEIDSCREDELRHKRLNDEDDDPSAVREGEQLVSGTQTGMQTSAQGESSKDGQDLEKEKM